MESETDDTKLIDLDAITTEGSQTRASLRREAVVDYARLLRDGARFPPAVVYSDGAALHLACGHHRRAAYRAIGRTKMPCIVRQGTRWDAVEAGIRDNQQHLGERLTRQDKRHNIRLVLREHPDWSDRAVGDLVGASPTTAGKVRAELASECPIGQSTVRLGRDGRRIDTATVGRKQVDGPRATDAGPRVAVADDETAGAGASAQATDTDTDPETPARVPTGDAGQRFRGFLASLAQSSALLDLLGRCRPGPLCGQVERHLTRAREIACRWAAVEGIDLRSKARV